MSNNKSINRAQPQPQKKETENRSQQVSNENGKADKQKIRSKKVDYVVRDLPIY